MTSELARTIMVQGTSSHVGKSVLCTALCRIFKQDGYRVAPFKSQNMSLNSYVTREGGEIGRAQAAQAEACGIDPSVLMNPILLKPKKDMVSQVIVRGKPLRDMTAVEYRSDYVPVALGVIEECLKELRTRYDIVVIEGAGSPAEVNLKDRDIANMKVAEIASAPVLLVADINLGGVFASLIGTLDLLDPAERDRVAGLVVNKFRGDLGLFLPGVDFLEKKTGKPVLGVLPYIHEIGVAEEDSVSLDHPGTGNKIPTLGQEALDIVVIRLPRISNFTDFDPLVSEAGVSVRYTGDPDKLGHPDAIVIPGTKNTVDDLMWMNLTGLSARIREFAAAGVPVVGICGGFQMLGSQVLDPNGLEGSDREVPGIGLLPIITTFEPDKVLSQVSARILPNSGPFGSLAGRYVTGYEIHMGRTAHGDGAVPLFNIAERQGNVVDVPDGAIRKDGDVFGTYIHGLFENEPFRQAWLDHLRAKRVISGLNTGTHPTGKSRTKEEAYDRLAGIVRGNLDMERVYDILGCPRR